jgi:hypothetical protein
MGKEWKASTKNPSKEGDRRFFWMQAESSQKRSALDLNKITSRALRVSFGDKTPQSKLEMSVRLTHKSIDWFWLKL